MQYLPVRVLPAACKVTLGNVQQQSCVLAMPASHLTDAAVPRHAPHAVVPCAGCFLSENQWGPF